MHPLPRHLLLAALSAAAFAPAAHAQLPSVPLLGAETVRGTHGTAALEAERAGARVVDGRGGDWSGDAPGFSGATIRSRGELVYTDHLFDAYGADDGKDAAALETFDGTQSRLPEAYRLEILLRQDPAGEFGAPTPEQLQYKMNYGDLPMQAAADLSEVRAGVQGDHLWLLGRTTTMTAAGETGLLALLDTAPGDAQRDVGFGTNLRSRKAELAVLAVGDRGFVRDLQSGEVSTLPAGSVATDAAGWNNGIELRVNRAVLGIGDSVGLAVMTGKAAADGAGLANVANLAFRAAEPVREWFDKRQALALHAGDVDAFFRDADLAALAAGANERYVPGAGYHERVFTSSELISRESGADGILQHYGVYLPAAAAAPGAGPSPLQLWLHWRGGTAHSAGATIPRFFRDAGDAYDTIVVSPRGRGSSSWYVGKGHVDVMEVWADVHGRFAVDENRRYVAGHSMGGWGSFLMTLTHPDWFAAALPASPPVTQGAWTGLDFPGCDNFRWEEYTPCYVQANGGDARTQHTRRLLENVRHVPWAIYHGTADELVPSSGVARQVERLAQLGYRHRLYMFHTQEHYGPPVWDQWADAAKYMHSFTRPENPGRVTLIRDMPFEQVTERVNGVQVDGRQALDFSFDRAYWVSGLQPRDENGVATFDGTTAARPEKANLLVPEAGGPTGVGQAGPYTMTGLAWLGDPVNAAPAARNAFSATLTGAKAVRLDLARMAIDCGRSVTATITTDGPVDVVAVCPGGERTLRFESSGMQTFEPAS